MSVKALYDYEFPSNDRVELFGDDQLVYVHWQGNPLFCAAACFRAPKAMPFGQFLDSMVKPWAASDPEFDPAAIGEWRLFDQPLSVDADTSLVDHGVGHKALLTFSA